MDEETEVRNPGSANVIGVKSWFAYVSVGALALLLFGILLPLAFGIGTIAAIVVFVCSALFVGYRVMMLRSVQVYYNDSGIWMYSGVLPWQKGSSGVKWRDIDGASFTQGFWSWSTRSYTVRIGHRFTKASEIVVTNIANGQDVVSKINDLHQEMLRSGRAG